MPITRDSMNGRGLVAGNLLCQPQAKTVPGPKLVSQMYIACTIKLYICIYTT